MKKNKIQSPAQKLISLAQQISFVNNKEKNDRKQDQENDINITNAISEEIYQLLKKDIDISSILEEVYQLVDENNYMVLEIIENTCDLVCANQIVYSDNKPHISSLFVIPFIFDDNAKNPVNAFSNDMKSYELLMDSFTKSGLIDQDESFYIHPYLYDSDEIFTFDYHKIFKLSTTMTDLLVNNSTFDQKDSFLPNNTQYTVSKQPVIKFLIGNVIRDQNKQYITQEDEEERFKQFIKLSAQPLKKLLKLDNYRILMMDNFYDGIITGMDIYTSSIRTMKIDITLKKRQLSPHAVNVNLRFPPDSTPVIELISKIDNKIFYALDLEKGAIHETEIMVNHVTNDLLLLNFRQEDIFVTLDNVTIPLLKLMNEFPQDTDDDDDDIIDDNKNNQKLEISEKDDFYSTKIPTKRTLH